MVMSLGHCHPRLVEVVQRQVAELSFTYRFSFRNGPMLELARGAAQHLAAARHVVLLQLVGLGVGRVGDPARAPLLAAARAGRQDRPDLALAVVPRLDAGRALALGLQVARLLRADPGQAPGGAGAECRHPAAPASRRGGGLGRGRARGRDHAPWGPERRGGRDRARHRRLGRGHRPAAGLHAPSVRRDLRPSRPAAGLRRDDHGLRAHGGVVRRRSLARGDARHHHVREGRDQRHRAVLGRARERSRGRALRAVAAGLPLRATRSRATRSAAPWPPRRSA